jgi:predicted transcriptional regulator
LNFTHENDSHNFLHFANLALLLYIKHFQDRLNPYLTRHLLNRFGISPQYVSELLTELVEEGVLRRNGRELIIVDQSGLWHEIDFEELILNH